jgi:hypothetical protein
MRKIIDVDENGCDAEGGFDARLLWNDRAERTGCFERVEVTRRFPDGRLEYVIQARLTPKGAAMLAELQESGTKARVGPSGQIVRLVG